MGSPIGLLRAIIFASLLAFAYGSGNVSMAQTPPGTPEFSSSMTTRPAAWYRDGKRWYQPGTQTPEKNYYLETGRDSKYIYLQGQGAHTLSKMKLPIEGGTSLLWTGKEWVNSWNLVKYGAAASPPSKPTQQTTTPATPPAPAKDPEVQVECVWPQGLQGGVNRQVYYVADDAGWLITRASYYKSFNYGGVPNPTRSVEIFRSSGAAIMTFRDNTRIEGTCTKVGDSKL